MMPFDIIIPARYGSTRLPGKPLLDLLGKTLIERVYLAAKSSHAERVIIATDDERIMSEVSRFGGEACMTAVDHLSGTDRLAEVISTMGIEQSRVIVNVQGDEPFVNPQLINKVAKLLIDDVDLNMSTACHLLANETEQDLEVIANPNRVKVVLNDEDEALYFSRSPIPYLRNKINGANPDYYQHMGIYGYRAGFVSKFSAMPASPLELSESLEQLRVLHAGHRIKLIRYEGEPAIGIDTAEDVDHAIERLKQV